MTLGEKLGRVSSQWVDLAKLSLEYEVDDVNAFLETELRTITLCGARKHTHETWLAFHLESGEAVILLMLYDGFHRMFLA